MVLVLNWYLHTLPCYQPILLFLHPEHRRDPRNYHLCASTLPDSRKLEGLQGFPETVHSHLQKGSLRAAPYRTGSRAAEQAVADPPWALGPEAGGRPGHRAK